MLMQLDDLQCWGLAFFWARVQFNQMQKYVGSNLYTAETSLAGQRWDPRVKGGATDSCHEICQWHFIFPVEGGLGGGFKAVSTIWTRLWEPGICWDGGDLLLVQGCSLCVEVILAQEEKLQTPDLDHVCAATVNQGCFALLLLGGAAWMSSLIQ